MNDVAGGRRAAVVYMMGDLCVDAGRRIVVRGSEEIALPKLSFDLLLVLAEAAPNAVSIDEFMDSVWRGLVVSPETVSQRVKLLRDALGDDPKNPRYLAGIRGHGYRVIPPVSRKVPLEPAAAVTPTTQAIEPAPLEIPPASAAPRRLSRKLAFLGLGALALGLVAWGVIRLDSRRPAPNSVLVVGTAVRAVAVLPFDNLGVDHSDDYIALGLSEMVLNRLAGIPTLRVIARTSAFALRGRQLDAKEIGRRLNAHYLVEGTVQHAASRLRVTAQIIDVDTSKEFSPVHIDKPLDAIFDLQDEIADHVAAALAVRVGDASKFKPEQARSAKMAAYLEYLQGRADAGHFRLVDMKAAAEHFTKAIQIDPEFAAAYSGLATAESSIADSLQQNDGSAHAHIAELIEKALSLDDGLGEAYIARADFNSNRDPAGAEADFRKGLDLSPSDALGFSTFAEALNSWHRPEEAQEMLEHAIAIDPLAPRPVYIKALLFLSSHPDIEHEREFEGLMEGVLRLDPDYTNALVRLADAKSYFNGEFAEGAKLIERALRVDPDPKWVREQAVQMYLGAGDLPAARSVAAESRQYQWAGAFTLTLYGGDWRQAADLVFNAPSTVASDSDDYLRLLAIQLYAHNTRQFDRAIDYLRTRAGLPAGKEFDGDDFDISIILAILLKDKGDDGAARKLATKALNTAGGNDSVFPATINRAKAHILAGEYERALEELAKCLAAKNPYMLYGWTLPMDPVWDPVRTDPRFQALYRHYADNVEAQHNLLAEMRRNGEIPMRGDPASASSIQ